MLIAFVVFLSALLLFQVQLIVAKHLLPSFGGTPAVWTSSQMFFQVLLLAGYAYAHRLASVQRRALQYRIHLGLLGTASAAMIAVAFWSGVPLLAPVGQDAGDYSNPTVLVLTSLLLSVGLPFFALATTGPLLQAWHSRLTSSLDRTYRLYALSNVGSFLALLSYPFIVEQYLELTQQAWIWACLFGAFVAGCAMAARRAVTGPYGDQRQPDVQPADEASLSPVVSAVRPTHMLLWTLFSFTTSMAFLSATNQLTQDIASVPFLWILPLAVYLLTFILSFDKPHWYSRRWYSIVAALASVAVLPDVVAYFRLPLQVVLHCVFLFSFCMLCHGEVVRQRPGTRHLTLFYLLIALGGALGGIFVSLVAPAVFADFWEFHIAILTGWVVVALAWAGDKESPLRTGERWHFAALLLVGCVLLVRFPVEVAGLWHRRWLIAYGWPLALAGGAVLASAVCKVSWRTRFATSPLWTWAMLALLLVGVGMAFNSDVQQTRAGSLQAARNFYGVVRVVTETAGSAEVLRLVHGTTLHGVQWETLGRNAGATAYYSPSTGIASAVSLLRARTAVNTGQRTAIHFGVVGMGVGTMTAFAESGDRVRFYEINHEVIDIATGPYFTFVRHTPSDVTIVEGDGRLSLERELRNGGSHRFDLLALDAFSSDSVPVHLMTVEAFRLYAAHLSTDASILAVNVTNRYLDLEPVVAAHARALGFHAVRVDSDGDRPVPVESSWILMSRDPAISFDPALLRNGARPLRAEAVSFTDRYSNLFRVLR